MWLCQQPESSINDETDCPALGLLLSVPSNHQITTSPESYEYAQNDA